MRLGKRARAAVVGVAVMLVASGLELGLVRSFEFLPFPKAIEPWRPGEETRAALAAAREESRALPRPERAPARGLTLVIVDGMRLDVSREMPSLLALGERGRFDTARADFPSFSKTSYATILTGAPGPRVHGFLSNYRREAVPVESLVDVAREAGVHTRYLTDGLSWIPRMFPAFADTPTVDVGRWAETIAAGPHPHLTVVYFGEPDHTAHAHGPRSPQALEVSRRIDAHIGRLAAGLDLEREALVVVSDHGHVDRGGHGGHEEECLLVPAIFCGAGFGKGRGAGAGEPFPLRDIARASADALGLRPPAGALLRLPRPPRLSPLWNGLPALLALAAVAAYVRVRLVRPRTLAAAALGIAAFFGLFALRGYPFSWSCINEDAHIPLFAAEIVAFAAAGHLLGSLLARDRGPSGHGPTALALAVALAAALGAVCGPTAATALDFPQVAFLYHLSLALLFAKGLIAAAAGLVRPGPAPSGAA